jgi:malate dehydrogenase (oxaloacetate-decarboxylating)(NADP+)
VGADVFLGVSAKGPVTRAIANPDPEITLEDAQAVRSDDPNQVNNVPGFPYLFRGGAGYSRPRHQ